MDLPLLNACLNGTCAALLVSGIVAIKGGNRLVHERLMQLATLVSGAFLVSYVYYHFVVQPDLGPTRFRHEGAIKTAYFVMLVTHIVLAIVNVPLVLRVLWLAHKERWSEHKRLAKVAFPVWMYVSVTGVLVYLALYVWNGPA